MNRTALGFALFIAITGVVLLFMYKQRYEDETAGGEPIAVLTATQDIPLGTVVTDRMLGVRTVPEAFLESRHVKATDASRIIGVRVSMEVKANESILWSDLAIATGEQRDLSSLVKNGMRAITIQTDSTSAFGGLLRPGDRIDAFLTTAKRGGNDARATIPLLQNVLVLAVGRDTGETMEGVSNRPGGDRQITLAVTMTQAQTVALAVDRGRLTLALRSPDDTAVVGDLGETTVASVIKAERGP